MFRVPRRWVLIPYLAAALAVGEEQGIESTVITSKRLTFDYKRSIAVFEGDVEVKDPRMRMTADEMRVIFNADHSVRSVTAIGNVRLTQGEKKASCRKAIYLAKARTVDLLGDARVEQEGHLITGDVITIHLDREEMVCEPGHAVITSPPSGKESRSEMRFLP